MDHAVQSLDVSDNHLGFVDIHLAAVDLNGHIRTLQGGSAGQIDDILSHYFTGCHMVEQDVLELLQVFRLEQGFDCTSRQPGEGLIGGGEDGEGTFSKKLSKVL